AEGSRRGGRPGLPRIPDAPLGSFFRRSARGPSGTGQVLGSFLPRADPGGAHRLGSFFPGHPRPAPAGRPGEMRFRSRPFTLSASGNEAIAEISNVNQVTAFAFFIAARKGRARRGPTGLRHPPRGRGT